MPGTPEEYKALRNEFDPRNIGSPINFVFLAESPPASGGYFYDVNSLRYEFLFRAMMKLIGLEFRNPLSAVAKETGLRGFQQCGCKLIDSIYLPVDDLHDNIAHDLILGNYPNLCAELDEHCTPCTRIIIIKTTLYDTLYSKLMDDGYPVINGTIRVPFPSTGQQTRFYKAINMIKNQNNINSFCQQN